MITRLRGSYVSGEIERKVAQQRAVERAALQEEHARAERRRIAVNAGTRAHRQRMEALAQEFFQLMRRCGVEPHPLVRTTSGPPRIVLPGKKEHEFVGTGYVIDRKFFFSPGMLSISLLEDGRTFGCRPPRHWETKLLRRYGSDLLVVQEHRLDEDGHGREEVSTGLSDPGSAVDLLASAARRLLGQ